MKRVLDFDARRKARYEAFEEAPAITLAGETVDLPFELPARFIELLQEQNPVEALRLILGDSAHLFEDLDPSVEDYEVVMEFINDVYMSPLAKRVAEAEREAKQKAEEKEALKGN